MITENEFNFKYNPAFVTDSYKLGHFNMYPDNTTEIFCNLTPRSTKYFDMLIPKYLRDEKNKIVVCGIRPFIQQLYRNFKTNFFDIPFEHFELEYKTLITPFLGGNDPKHIINKWRQLHEFKSLPLTFKALDEGTTVSAGTPIMTWWNTVDEFAWLPNYLETYISSEVWKPITAASIARAYKKILLKYAKETGIDPAFVDIQAHDFSARGLSGVWDTARTGTGHLLFFKGSDNIIASKYVENYYGSEDLIACSVPASEHSVMCMGEHEGDQWKTGELKTYERILEKYPTGIVSIVSDTWDYWGVLTKIMPLLKEKIINRGENELGLCKVVIRPDSGNPADIICGTKQESRSSDAPEVRGSVELLNETFGGKTNAKGFIELNPKIGLIYGDSITPLVADDVLFKLKEQHYASNSIVFGIGSYTYQYMTRDTLGMAVKATHAVINGKKIPIQKAPKTDMGKKSHKGYLQVRKEGNNYITDVVNNPHGDDSEGYSMKKYLLNTIPVNIKEYVSSTSFDSARKKANEELNI